MACEAERATLSNAKDAVCTQEILTTLPQRDCTSPADFVAWSQQELTFYTGYWEKLKKANKACDAEEASLDNHRKCAVASEVKISCDTALASAEEAACKWSSSEISCGPFIACYQMQKKRFDNSVLEAQNEEASLKSQWRLSQRLRCLLGAMTRDGAVDADKLHACAQSGLRSAGHLTYTYPSFPSVPNCTRPKVSPGTQAYNATVYSDLPADVEVRAPKACRRGASVGTEFLVGTYNDGLFKCDAKGCGKFMSRCTSQCRWVTSIAVGTGDFFVMGRFTRYITRCRKEGSCETVRGNLYPTHVLAKEGGSSFYARSGRVVQECSMMPFKCTTLFPLPSSVGPTESLAVDSADNTFFLSSKKKGIYKCSRKGECSRLLAKMGIHGTRLDIDGGFLFSDWVPHDVKKCSQLRASGCESIRSNGFSYITDLLPEKSSYLVSNSAKYRVQRCPRIGNAACETLLNIPNPWALAWLDR